MASRYIRANYTSNPIPIPDTFLTSPPSKPVTYRPIDFASTQLPEYAGCIAFTLENVLSLEECNQLLALAEASAPTTGDTEEGEPPASPWKPALVAVGVGLESLAMGYRESDRIIWDKQLVVDRIWDRCVQAEGVREILSKPPRHSSHIPGTWTFDRLNERMRFLKYSPGQFFKRKHLCSLHLSHIIANTSFTAHCDAAYYTVKDDIEYQTWYTLQLYLNDEGLVGGATSFLSNGRHEKRLDVNPKAGSVLVFQHNKLLHEGAKVEAGLKYAMRTDILYKWEPEKGSGSKKDSKAKRSHWRT